VAGMYNVRQVKIIVDAYGVPGQISNEAA